jgi:hypothetical protein
VGVTGSRRVRFAGRCASTGLSGKALRRLQASDLLAMIAAPSLLLVLSCSPFSSAFELCDETEN